jgi:IstB-like ATP binding protein
LRSNLSGADNVGAPPRLLNAWFATFHRFRTPTGVAIDVGPLCRCDSGGPEDRRVVRPQRDLGRVKLLIIDELSYVPLSTTRVELLFEVFNQRYERGSTIVTSNLPFEEWTSVFGADD